MERLTRYLILAAMLGMLHWLFGNLYEQVVIAPNWIVDTPHQLQRLHAFFAHTTPTMYFVPISFLAPILAWIAHAIHRGPLATAELRRASLFAVLASAVNAVIVTAIVMRLFGDDYASESEATLHALCVRWNILNVVRMTFTAATAFWLFAGFRLLDRDRLTDGLVRSRADGAAEADHAATFVMPAWGPSSPLEVVPGTWNVQRGSMCLGCAVATAGIAAAIQPTRARTIQMESDGSGRAMQRV